MNVYIDTSVFLRRLFHEPNPLPKWGSWQKVFTSRIWQVEALRTVHRLRLDGRISDRDVATLKEGISVIHSTCTIIPVTEPILLRAEEAMPTSVATLDAIHLASAMALAPSIRIDRFFTHDKQLATAARCVGFAVEGVAV